MHAYRDSNACWEIHVTPVRKVATKHVLPWQKNLCVPLQASNMLVILVYFPHLVYISAIFTAIDIIALIHSKKV